ncbi:fimbria/pilus outer membrane usher protein [Pseudomonas chlororaphis subsp. aurantiaca]|uniref:fimbria/pilus outer membrane usher protein n=1 Tax=Pseudomonas chlororaphis TaxID=587753 RepID=UPI0027DE3C90|nr:fimbria/pilus outer membrane usher protein [Pseudomonas chlororaphis]WMI98145.1 fimbria/pilus outer membrane usher protein [Pseudomonas chlororaphis subsp. aurantiaca]
MNTSIRPLVLSTYNFWYVLPVLVGFLATTPLRAEPTQKPESSIKSQKATSESVSFDLDMLKSRGIDSKLAEYFAHAPRFREGTYMVTLFVNGARKGLVNAMFNSQGELIFDRNLLDKAELVIPDSSFKNPASADSKSSSTYNFVEAYPSTIVEPRPGKEEVHLILPTDALRAPDQVSGNFNSGGTAAILNYNLLAMNSEFSSGTSEFRSVDTVAGFNAGDWIVRSRQTYTSQGNKSKVEHLYAYGQKTFTEFESIVQGGQINIANSIFSGDAITGVQVIPETGLRRNSGGSGAIVEGIAYSTARVEVRQNNALIHTSVVPAGPFTLSNLQLLSGNSDLDVTVIEADGSRQSFSIPAASLGGGTLGATPGYSFAAGQYRPYGDDDSKTPTLLTGTGTWQLNRKTNVTSGLMGASGYQAAGWAVDHALTPASNLGVRQLVSNATEEGVRGTQVSASLNTMATDRLSLGLSATQQTEGYRDLVDTTYRTDDLDWLNSRYRDQYSASVGWTDKTLGGFRLSHSHSTRFDGQPTQRLLGSWSKNFKHANVSLNVQKTMGESGRYGTGDSVYLSVSMPFGGRTLKTYVNADSNRTRTGATLNEQVNDNFGYRLQTERNSHNRETDMSVMTNILPRYTQATLGYSRSGSNSTTYNGGLIGGIVAHDDGITFSPYAVDDTFSILSVGDVPGVKISTPQGPVWTDYSGKAVAPSLQAYSNNRLEVSPKTLPRNVDILNGFKEIQAGRGSVNRVDFGVVSSRRILMTAKGTDGKPLDKGLSIFDGQNQYLTSVADHGQIFLPNIEADSRLTVSLAGGKSCSLNYTLAEKADVSAYFEAVDATCKPL